MLAGLGIDPAALTAGYRAGAAAAAALPRRDDGRAGDAPARVRRPPGRVRRPAAHRGARLGRGAAPARRPPGRRCARRTSRSTASFTAGVRGRRRRRGVRRPPGAGHRRRTAPTGSAIAIRGYAPEPPGTARRPGDPDDRAALAGLRLVVPARRRPGQRRLRRARLRRGQPRRACWPGWTGCCPASRPTGLKAHRLPLSTGRPRQPDGRVLLAGDAASLINPLTGEGIFYAVLSGALAGAAAAHGGDAGAAYRRALHARLGRHLRHSSTASWAQPLARGDGRRLPRRRGRPAGVRRRRRAWGWPTAGSPRARSPPPPAASADRPQLLVPRARPRERRAWIGVSSALPPVGSATTRVDPPRLSPNEGLFRPVSDAPKYPVPPP